MFWIKCDNLLIFFVFYSKKQEGVLSDNQMVNLDALNLTETYHSSNKTIRSMGRVLDEDVIEIFI